jgi:hypothetical protein
VPSFPRPELLNRPEPPKRFFNRFRPRWTRGKRSILEPRFRDSAFVPRQIALGILPPHIISCVPSLFHSFILAARSDLDLAMHSRSSWKPPPTSKIQGSFTDGFALLSVLLSCPEGEPARIQFPISIRMIEQLSPSLVTFSGNRTSRRLSHGVMNHNFRFHFS